MYVVTNQRFYAVYLVRGAVEHKTFLEHNRIYVAVESALIAIEPFDIFLLGVFIELVEEPVTEASGSPSNAASIASSEYPATSWA